LIFWWKLNDFNETFKIFITPPCLIVLFNKVYKPKGIKLKIFLQIRRKKPRKKLGGKKAKKIVENKTNKLLLGM
jgi:hypothetical protein